MKEQSAVDFLHSKILFNIGLDDNDIFKLRELVKIAKKLEEKQHGKTWDAALDKYEVRAGNYMRAYEDFDDYYAETYGSKGSGMSEKPNNHTEAELPKPEISDESWEGCDGCTEQDEVMYKNGYVKGYNAAIGELPKEISDEEIWEASIDYDNGATYDTPIVHFQQGAFWYREQLKQRQ
jgi:hypothetical protein